MSPSLLGRTATDVRRLAISPFRQRRAAGPHPAVVARAIVEASLAAVAVLAIMACLSGVGLSRPLGAAESTPKPPVPAVVAANPATAPATTASAADQSAANARTELLLTDGSFRAARLVECQVPQRLVLTTNRAAESVDWPRVVRWGAAPDLPRELGEAGRNAAICLSDGGWLLAEEASFDGRTLRWKSSLFGAVETPRNRVRGMLFHVPADPRQRDLLWDRVQRGESTQDRILLRNGDDAAGAVRTLDADRLQCDVATQSISVPIARLVSVVLRRDAGDERAGPPPAAIAGFADGSRLMVTSTLGKGGSLAVTPIGLPPLKAALSDLVFLQACSSSSQGSRDGKGGGSVEYLSDRKPLVYRHVPFLSIAWPYRDDRDVTGGLLRAGGRTFAKGLGVHSAARLEYAVPEGARQFQAEAAIDDCAAAAGGGSVRFRVLVDGQAKYAGPVVRGGDPPTPIRVDVAGAKRVDLVVDFADRGDQGDRADWLDARFVR